MKKRIFIFLAVLILTNCAYRKPVPLLASIERIAPPVLVEQPRAISKPVPIQPKIKTIDWQVSFSPLLQHMFAIEEINDGSVLLVNTMKNATNGNVQTNKATRVLIKLIADAGGKFQVININQFNMARKTLGLSSEDSLESRSKAVGLARYLNAQYVLYSTAYGDVKQPTLDLQLILVKSGEIIWSGNRVAQD